MSPSEASDREMVIERVFDAPRELVFKAWTDPAQLAKWWGPEGVTAVTTEYNFTVGGAWRYVMSQGGGTGIGMTSVFVEIIPPERVVTEDTMERTGGFPTPADVTVTAIFEEQGDKTKLTLRIMHASVADRRKNQDIGIQFGWGACFDSLDKYLEQMLNAAER